MKELQERGSRWRPAQCEKQGWVQRAEMAALFDRPSRGCTEPKGKIKTQGEIHSTDVAAFLTGIADSSAVERSRCGVRQTRPDLQRTGSRASTSRVASCVSFAAGLHRAVASGWNIQNFFDRPASLLFCFRSRPVHPAACELDECRIHD